MRASLLRARCRLRLGADRLLALVAFRAPTLNNQKLANATRPDTAGSFLFPRIAKSYLRRHDSATEKTTFVPLLYRQKLLSLR
jgi:hypothetical protein